MFPQRSRKEALAKTTALGSNDVADRKRSVHPRRQFKVAGPGSGRGGCGLSH